MHQDEVWPDVAEGGADEVALVTTEVAPVTEMADRHILFALCNSMSAARLWIRNYTLSQSFGKWYFFTLLVHMLVAAQMGLEVTHSERKDIIAEIYLEKVRREIRHKQVERRRAKRKEELHAAELKWVERHKDVSQDILSKLQGLLEVSLMKKIQEVVDKVLLITPPPRQRRQMAERLGLITIPPRSRSPKPIREATKKDQRIKKLHLRTTFQHAIFMLGWEPLQMRGKFNLSFFCEHLYSIYHFVNTCTAIRLQLQTAYR